MLKILYISSLLCVVNAKFRFDNYTLYKIIPSSVEQIKVLQNLQEQNVRYDFWTDPVPTSQFVNILSSPEYKEDLENFLYKNRMSFEILMSNIQE